MPSGRTHDRITLWSLPVVGLASLCLTGSSALTLATVSGFLFGGLMLGPDLDTRSIHHRRWGWFRWIWIPYRNSISHRSPLSHGPIVGTTIRVVYLLVVVMMAVAGGAAAANEMLNLGWTWGQLGRLLAEGLTRYSQGVIAVAVGLELGALGHYTADWGLSSYKRVRKRYPMEGWRALLIPFKPSKQRRRSKTRPQSKTRDKRSKGRSRRSAKPAPARNSRANSSPHDKPRDIDLPDFGRR